MAENISIKRNVAANYASNLYAVLVSVLMAPVYLSYMGTEAYGLIGFFTMLTALFQLLDMGLTPTIVRETALFRGGQITVGRLRVFIRGLEIIFGIVSVTTALVILLLTHPIATHWLKVGNLPITDVEVAVGIMGAIVPLRWVAGLYRGLVVGFERMTWLSAYNIAIATLRFVGVLAVFHLVGTNVKFFFAYQFLVSVIDLSGIAIISHRLVGQRKGAREPFSWAPLKANATFSLVIAFVSTSWVVLTQSDKLVLSKVIPLAAFGIFSLAVAAANVISIVGGPISQALLPRLTKLFAEGREDALYRLYANATQTVEHLRLSRRGGAGVPGRAGVPGLDRPCRHRAAGRAHRGPLCHRQRRGGFGLLRLLRPICQGQSALSLHRQCGAVGHLDPRLHLGRHPLRAARHRRRLGRRQQPVRAVLGAGHPCPLPARPALGLGVAQHPADRGSHASGLLAFVPGGDLAREPPGPDRHLGRHRGSAADGFGRRIVLRPRDPDGFLQPPPVYRGPPASMKLALVRQMRKALAFSRKSKNYSV